MIKKPGHLVGVVNVDDVNNRLSDIEASLSGSRKAPYPVHVATHMLVLYVRGLVTVDFKLLESEAKSAEPMWAILRMRRKTRISVSVLFKRDAASTSSRTSLACCLDVSASKKNCRKHIGTTVH